LFHAPQLAFTLGTWDRDQYNWRSKQIALHVTRFAMQVPRPFSLSALMPCILGALLALAPVLCVVKCAAQHQVREYQLKLSLMTHGEAHSELASHGQHGQTPVEELREAIRSVTQLDLGDTTPLSGVLLIIGFLTGASVLDLTRSVGPAPPPPRAISA
jgi:hypothetical protein